MAPNFGRSISFPLTPARSFSKLSRHVRSVSLPGTTSSHPLLANLHARIAALRAWIRVTAAPDSSIPAGLANIHALHAALADLLLLPASGAVLRCTTSNTGDRLLDAFLLADTHQGFQECLLSLRHAAAESRAALRRGDTGRLVSASRSQRRAEKDLARLAASVSAVSSKCSRLNLVAGEQAEMAYALVEAADASAAASAAVFLAAASMSSAASSCKKTATFIPTFARKSTAPETAEATVERLHTLEQCLDECDGVCDLVLRSVVQTRVSLLNIMTPTIWSII